MSEKRDDPCFRHRPLSEPRRQFRLLKVSPYEDSDVLQCELRHFDRADTMAYGSYTALSYTWGELSASHSIHMTNGSGEADPSHFAVTQNLFEVLSHISRMRKSYQHSRRWSGWWWIDALCIVQDDSQPEKDIQIKSMRNIYGQAQEVFAWIGPGDSDTAKAIRYIKHQPYGLRYAAEKGAAYYHLKKFERSFGDVALYVRDIFSKAYWSRVWILQELCMSANTTLACGANELPWKVLLDFATQVAAADLGSSHHTLQEAQRQITKRQPVWLLTEIYRERRVRLNLAELIFLSKDSQCGKDKKDHIRGLLGMVGRGEGCNIDPEEHGCPCSIIYHATRAIIQDMREDKSVPLIRKQQCEKLARSAHYDLLIGNLKANHRREHCKDYKVALSNCRDIASNLCVDTILLSQTVGQGGETWDFTQYGMRRQDYLNHVRSLLMRPLTIALLVMVIFLLPRDGMAPGGRYDARNGYPSEGITYN